MFSNVPSPSEEQLLSERHAGSTRTCPCFSEAPPFSDTALCNYPAKDSVFCLHVAAAGLLPALILIESQVLIVKGD